MSSTAGRSGSRPNTTSPVKSSPWSFDRCSGGVHGAATDAKVANSLTPRLVEVAPSTIVASRERATSPSNAASARAR